MIQIIENLTRCFMVCHLIPKKFLIRISNCILCFVHIRTNRTNLSNFTLGVTFFQIKTLVCQNLFSRKTYSTSAKYILGGCYFQTFKGFYELSPDMGVIFCLVGVKAPSVMLLILSLFVSLFQIPSNI